MDILFEGSHHPLEVGLGAGSPIPAAAPLPVAFWLHFVAECLDMLEVALIPLQLFLAL